MKREIIDKRTTIQVNKSTRDALAALGNKDDSFDTIINRLIDFYRKGQ